MRKILMAILITVSMLGLSACSANEYMGFDKRDFTVIAEADSHDGFLGDGYGYLILDCSANREKAIEIINSWKSLPLSDNLARIMYGRGYMLAETAGIPEIENGYYCFTDRYSESTDPHSDAELFSRASFNFSLSVYDTDTDRMYYFEFDT